MFLGAGRAQDEDLSIKRVLTAKNCAYVGTKPVSASVLKQLQICRIGVLFAVDPTLHNLKRADVGDDENRNRQILVMVVNIEKDARLSETLTRWNGKAILTMKGP